MTTKELQELVEMTIHSNLNWNKKPRTRVQVAIDPTHPERVSVFLENSDGSNVDDRCFYEEFFVYIDEMKKGIHHGVYLIVVRFEESQKALIERHSLPKPDEPTG